jgi:hypothetical protein
MLTPHWVILVSVVGSFRGFGACLLSYLAANKSEVVALNSQVWCTSSSGEVFGESCWTLPSDHSLSIQCQLFEVYGCLGSYVAGLNVELSYSRRSLHSPHIPIGVR